MSPTVREEIGIGTVSYWDVDSEIDDDTLKMRHRQQTGEKTYMIYRNPVRLDKKKTRDVGFQATRVRTF